VCASTQQCRNQSICGGVTAAFCYRQIQHQIKETNHESLGLRWPSTWLIVVIVILIVSCLLVKYLLKGSNTNQLVRSNRGLSPLNFMAGFSFGSCLSCFHIKPITPAKCFVVTHRIMADKQVIVNLTAGWGRPIIGVLLNTQKDDPIDILINCSRIKHAINIENIASTIAVNSSPKLSRFWQLNGATDCQAWGMVAV